MTSRIALKFGLLISFLITKSVLARDFNPDLSWPDVSVSNMKVYGSGIVLDQENNVVVLHRSDTMQPGAPANRTIPEDVVIVIDGTTGKVLRSWGKNMFVKPHGIEITESGDIFITDSVYHQVLKFAYIPSTKLWNETPVLTLGVRYVRGDDHTHFCTPADVAVDHVSGEFYVADGYCNSRIVKFDQGGNYITEFSAGSVDGSPPTPFNITHAVALAFPQTEMPKQRREGLVFVADRDNSRIQVFGTNGTFLYEVTHGDIGSPRTMLLGIAHANVKTDSNFGLLYAVNGYLPMGQPKVFEIEVGSTNAKVLSSFPTSRGDVDPTFRETPHDITMSKDGKLIYTVVATYEKLIIRKFELEEAGGGSSHVSIAGILLFVSLIASTFNCLSTNL